MKLIAINSIWKSKGAIKPGQTFDEDDQGEIDRLISAKAARPLQRSITSGRGTTQSVQTGTTVEISEEDIRKLGLIKAVSFDEVKEMIAVFQQHRDRIDQEICSGDVQKLEMTKFISADALQNILNSFFNPTTTAGFASISAPGIPDINPVNELKVSDNLNETTEDDLGGDFADVTGNDNLTGETLPSDHGITDLQVKPSGVDGEALTVALPPYSIPGIDATTIDVLVKGGYDTFDKVAAATKADLLKVPSLGYSNAAKIAANIKAKK